jgi:hypothetical protein
VCFESQRCFDSRDCFGGDACVDGTCRAACFSNDDCGLGAVCADSRCAPAPDPYVCPEGCPEGAACEWGECVAPEPAPAPVSAPPAEVPIAYGKAGLKLGDTPIFGGQVDAAAWDSAQELLWFTNRSTMNVIDLRDPQRTVVPIAEKMPDGSFAVTGVSTADSGTSYAGLYPILVFGAKPKIDPGSGAYGGIWEDQQNM